MTLLDEYARLVFGASEQAQSMLDPLNLVTKPSPKNARELLLCNRIRQSGARSDGARTMSGPVKFRKPRRRLVCVPKPRSFDLVKESRTIGHDGRAALLPFEAIGFATQVGTAGPHKSPAFLRLVEILSRDRTRLRRTRTTP
jgi:hypothetical protein